MSDQRDGGIAWTDQTWNPVRGCSRVSPGCENCYAEAVAGRFCGPGQPYEGLVRIGPNGPRWTGKVRVVDELLDAPLRWRRPRRVFVDSMSDLLHEAIDYITIGRIFGLMAEAHWHTFQVLTKRSQRLREWSRGVAHYPAGDRSKRPVTGWPPNVWLGVSAEDQQRLEDRAPDLLATHAAVRFLSLEPLLGPIDLSRFMPGVVAPQGIDWVIVGGESGPGARPCDIDWIRSIVEQCRAAAVPVFVKQLGAVPVTDEAAWAAEKGGVRMLSASNRDRAPAGTVPLLMHDRKGADPSEWPEDLRVREFPEARS